MTKKENIKEEKVFGKYQANTINAYEKYLLLEIPSQKLGRSK